MRARYISAGMAVLLAVSACNDTREAIEVSGTPLVLTAYQEDSPERKTAVEDGGKQVFWEPGDEIKVFSGSRSGKFSSSAEGLEAVTTFTGYLEGTDPDVQDIWAVYPYSDDATFDGECITTTIPSVQIARPGTFAQGANVAIAHSNTTELQFYNVGGGIRFSLKESGVKYVVLESIGSESLAGTATISLNAETPAVVGITENKSAIALFAEEGQYLPHGEWLYISTLPVALQQGFRLRFVSDDSFGVLGYEKPVELKRRVYISINEADDKADNYGIEETDLARQSISEIVQACVTDEQAIESQVEEKRAELEANPLVDNVDIDDVATTVTFTSGEVVIYPYDYPSVFDEEEISTNRSVDVSSLVTKASSESVDSQYFDASVYIFNLFSEESGRKNQNKLMAGVKHVFQQAGMTVCYLGRDNFTRSNVEKAVGRNAIIFFSTLGNKDGTYICSGEEKHGWAYSQKEILSGNGPTFETLPVMDYKGERIAINVAKTFESYSGNLAYFASCNTMNSLGDKFKNKNILGWNGVNRIGQAYALIIADYMATYGKTYAAFSNDFSEEHSNDGTIRDPLVSGTKLVHTDYFWWTPLGNNKEARIGWTERNSTLAFSAPCPGTCKSSTSKYTVDLVYNNPGNVVTDGKNDTYENGNKYWLYFDSLSGASFTSSNLRIKNNKVSYTGKSFSPGVWRISSVQEDTKGYKIEDDCTYLILSKKFKENDGELVDYMPPPQVESLVATVDASGVFLAGDVLNRSIDGLETGFMYYKFTPQDLESQLSRNDSLSLLLNNGKKIMSSGTYEGYFGVMLKDVDEDSHYQAMAYATDESGQTAYGGRLTFSTQSHSSPIPEAVDLGLSVKWASFNLGASKPEEYGDYFAWGETEPKTEYLWDNYRWSNGNEDTLNKYNTDSTYGTVDNKVSFYEYGFGDDPAHKQLGDSWYTPSYSDWAELKSTRNCTWTWTDDYQGTGIKGYIVTSNKTQYAGNELFLPFVKSQGSYDTRSFYWYDCLYSEDNPASATCLVFYKGSIGLTASARCYGLAVRPVYKNIVQVESVVISDDYSRSNIDLKVGDSITLYSVNISLKT